VLYEIREYVAVPGRLGALLEFFNEHTIPMFAKYDMELVHAGVTWIGTHSFNELVYTMRFADVAELDRKWTQLVSDPGWAAAFAAKEADGPLVQSMSRRLLDPAPIGGASVDAQC
jgi:hypothetical protein